MPGIGLLPLETVAGEGRMIGDVLIECELEPGERRTLAGFENHAGRTRLDPGAEPLGRVLARRPETLSKSGVSTTVRRLPATSRIWRFTIRSDSTGRMPRGASRSWTTTYGTLHAL